MDKYTKQTETLPHEPRGRDEDGIYPAYYAYEKLLSLVGGVLKSIVELKFEYI